MGQPIMQILIPLLTLLTVSLNLTSCGGKKSRGSAVVQSPFNEDPNKEAGMVTLIFRQDGDKDVSGVRLFVTGDEFETTINLTYGAENAVMLEVPNDERIREPGVSTTTPGASCGIQFNSLPTGTYYDLPASGTLTILVMCETLADGGNNDGDDDDDDDTKTDPDTTVPGGQAPNRLLGYGLAGTGGMQLELNQETKAPIIIKKEAAGDSETGEILEDILSDSFGKDKDIQGQIVNADPENALCWLKVDGAKQDTLGFVIKPSSKTVLVRAQCDTLAEICDETSTMPLKDGMIDQTNGVALCIDKEAETAKECEEGHITKEIDGKPYCFAAAEETKKEHSRAIGYPVHKSINAANGHALGLALDSHYIGDYEGVVVLYKPDVVVTDGCSDGQTAAQIGDKNFHVCLSEEKESDDLAESIKYREATPDLQSAKASLEEHPHKASCSLAVRYQEDKKLLGTAAESLTYVGEKSVLDIYCQLGVAALETKLAAPEEICKDNKVDDIAFEKYKVINGKRYCVVSQDLTNTISVGSVKITMVQAVALNLAPSAKQDACSQLNGTDAGFGKEDWLYVQDSVLEDKDGVAICSSFQASIDANVIVQLAAPVTETHSYAEVDEIMFGFNIEAKSIEVTDKDDANKKHLIRRALLK